jgi:hypothetical protein
MTRLWPAGEPIQVECDSGGHPTAFTWQEREHIVQGIAKHWRVDEDWWQQHLWRDYFKLYTDTGLLLIVYHDLLSGRWHLQRLYD